MKSAFILLIALFDILLSPIVLIAAILLKIVRRAGLNRTPISRAIFDVVGILPIRNHYYEPFINSSMLRQPLDQPRDLPGFNLNVSGQLALLEQLSYGSELLNIPREPSGDPLEFHLMNGAFEAGDADYLYCLVRHYRPKKILEIGAGMSTLLIQKAIAKNLSEYGIPTCEHTCIEPFERDWLERTGAKILRQRVETVDIKEFVRLRKNDILFIDSTHVIRPQGDVLFEYLQVLPKLNQGVLIHIHDVFTPRDYPESWILQHRRLWNEQYLLEAFLSCNTQFKIIAAVNYLSHDHRDLLMRQFPLFASVEKCSPGSLWLQRI